MSWQHRFKVVPSLVAIALAIAGLTYRHELVAWFDGSGTPASPVSAKGTTHRGEAHAHPPDGIAHYTCPMHPSVRTATPGKCPLCGMDLVAVYAAEVQSGTVILDAARRKRIGLATAPVTRRELNLSIRGVGAVRYDETRLTDVSLRVGGWVQKLLVAETGQRVAAGQTLFTLYSPELYAAQLELLTARKAAPEGLAQAQLELSRSARQKLVLLGMADKQIDALIARGAASDSVPITAPAGGYVIDKDVVQGARVDAGTRVYRIADLSKVWVDADFYEADFQHVRTGQSVQIVLPHLTDASYEGRIDYVYPALDGTTRTGRARVVLSNPKLDLKPDMYADVSLALPLGERLAIPDSAVLYTGPRRVVFVDKGDDKLEPRSVQLGVHVDGFYEVLSGVVEGERVVSSANFLVAAESRLRSAAPIWEDTPDAQP